MTVVGAGVIGVEYASMFGALGTKVTVVDKRDRVLPFLDSEIGEAFQYLLRRANVTFRMRESVAAVEPTATAAARRWRSPPARSSCRRPSCTRSAARATPRSWSSTRPGSRPTSAAGSRSTAAPDRGPAHLRGRRCGRRRPRRDRDGAGPDRRAARVRASRSRRCRSWCRRASTRSPRSRWSAAPRRQLTDAAIPYVTGVAHWRELARGLMSGDEDGMLKLLVSSEDRRLLGVHVIGTGATDLVHIGQAVMGGDSDDRLPRDRGLQLPDVRRVLQGRGAGRGQPHQGDGVGRPARPGGSPRGERRLVPRRAASAAAFAAAARVGGGGLARPPRRSARDCGRGGGGASANRSVEVAERLRELARDHEDLVRRRPARAAGSICRYW